MEGKKPPGRNPLKKELGNMIVGATVAIGGAGWVAADHFDNERRYEEFRIKSEVGESKTFHELVKKFDQLKTEAIRTYVNKLSGDEAHDLANKLIASIKKGGFRANLDIPELDSRLAKIIEELLDVVRNNTLESGELSLLLTTPDDREDWTKRHKQFEEVRRRLESESDTRSFVILRYLLEIGVLPIESINEILKNIAKGDSKIAKEITMLNLTDEFIKRTMKRLDEDALDAVLTIFMDEYRGFTPEPDIGVEIDRINRILDTLNIIKRALEENPNTTEEHWRKFEEIVGHLESWIQSSGAAPLNPSQREALENLGIKKTQSQ